MPDLRDILVKEFKKHDRPFIILHIMKESPKLFYNRYIITARDIDKIANQFGEKTKIAISAAPFGLVKEWITL